jgi:tetratricopeptide (TPR) repeat protein
MDPPGSEEGTKDDKGSLDTTWYETIFSGLFVTPADFEVRESNDVLDREESEYADDDPAMVEGRDGVEDDMSTMADTVGSLGKDLGDDMKSVESIDEDIFPNEDASIESDFSLEKHKKTKSSTFPKLRPPSREETVESVVEKKIQNIQSEGGKSTIKKAVPFLRNKMFPKTSVRKEENNVGRNGQSDSILDARRHLLVKELRRAVEEHGRFDARCANITAALGDLYEENGEYAQALRLHRDAVTVFSVKLGDDHRTSLQAKIRLSQVLENAGEYNEAISTYFYVISMTKALKGDKTPEAADIMTKMAGALRRQGNYELAIKTLKRALKVFREVFGDSHAQVSTTVDEIASLYTKIGNFEKASTILEEVVKLKAITTGIGSKEVAASLYELASCYECAEEYSKAMKNLKKAYKIYSDLDGELGERSILALERIALVYQATGQFKKASIAYLGVLRGRKRALGECHAIVADTYFDLGVSLRQTGQRDKAFKCMKRALNIYVGEGKHMRDIEMIAEVMHELAVIHKEKYDTADAIKTFKQEIAVRKKLGQSEHPSIAKSLNQLGLVEFGAKNHSRALSCFTEAIAIYQKAGKNSEIEYAEANYNAGLVYESTRKKQRCHDAFLEAARVFKEEGYKDDHPKLRKAISILKQK